MAVAAAAPDRGYSAPSVRLDSDEVVPIIRDDRVAPSAAGEYSFDVETGDGIVRSESGYGSEDNGAVAKQGTISFTHPDGSSFDLKFVANADGYQPESDALPVAPAFPPPHPPVRPRPDRIRCQQPPHFLRRERCAIQQIRIQLQLNT